MMRTNRSSYLISAGEYSGDLLAAELAQQIKLIAPDLRAFGLAGDTMITAGVEPILKLESFSIMGVLDVLLKIGELKRYESYLLSKVDQYQPKFAVLVDFPGFHFRLAEQLKLRGIPVYQYVAPKVWAWGEKRVRQLQRDFKAVLGVLPFEDEYFKKHGVNYHYVGSPHLDRTSKIQIDKESLGISPDRRVIALLPGSRPKEISYILPKLFEIKSHIENRLPDTTFVLPLATNLQFADLVAAHPQLAEADEVSPHHWRFGSLDVFHGMSLELMKIADGAVVASGTASLECGLLDTPMVVIYVMDEASYEIAMKTVKVPYACLINLMLKEMLVPEYIQIFDTQVVADNLIDILQNEVRNRHMRDAFRKIRDAMQPGAGVAAAAFIKKDMSL